MSLRTWLTRPLARFLRLCWMGKDRFWCARRPAAAAAAAGAGWERGGGGRGRVRPVRAESARWGGGLDAVGGALGQQPARGARTAAPADDPAPRNGGGGAASDPQIPASAPFTP